MFRSGWDGGWSRRRQAHEQGPAACGVLGDGGRGKTEAVPKKGFSRDESLERVRAEPAVLPAGWLRGRGGLMERRTARFRSPGAPTKPFLKGKPLRKQLSPANHPKSGAPL